jgi:hypothetical protein
MVVFCDNVSTVYMTSNPVHHQQTNHIELDIHFVHERVARGKLRVHHVPSAQQFHRCYDQGLRSESVRWQPTSSDCGLVTLLQLYGHRSRPGPAPQRRPHPAPRLATTDLNHVLCHGLIGRQLRPRHSPATPVCSPMDRIILLYM